MKTRGVKHPFGRMARTKYRPGRVRMIKVRAVSMVQGFPPAMFSCLAVACSRWRIGFIEGSHFTKQIMMK